MIGFLVPMRAMEREICLISLITCLLNRSEVPLGKKLFVTETFPELIFAIQYPRITVLCGTNSCKLCPIFVCFLQKSLKFLIAFVAFSLANKVINSKNKFRKNLFGKCLFHYGRLLQACTILSRTEAIVRFCLLSCKDFRYKII